MAKQTFTANQVLTAAQMNSLQANDYNWTVDTKTDSYVLVAGDAGKRIVMNAATAKTITVNTSVFTAGDTVWIHNINTGTCTVTAGTATVNTAGSLALAQWEGGALYFTSASTAIFFRGGGANYGVATGGSSSSITVSGVNYTLLTFTSTGTLTVTKAGLFDYTFVGPGGAGGDNGRGGGAGGLILQGTLYLSADQTITIGAGAAQSGITVGANQTSRGGNHTNIDNELSAFGGAYGGDPNGGTGIFGGGNGGNYNGAGAGTAGASGTDISSWLGQAGGTTIRCGGGGGASSSGAGGAGGSGGGGAGQGTSAAVAGTANTGGGGGGGKAGGSGAAGGSGIAYIRFKV